GNSLFNVIGFGKCGLEIKYPLKEASEEFEESDCSLKLIENPSSLRSKRLKSSSSSYNVCKKIKINSKEQKEFKDDKRIVQAQARFPKFKDMDNGEILKILPGNSCNDLKERGLVLYEKVKKKFHCDKDFFAYQSLVGSVVIDTGLEREDHTLIPGDTGLEKEDHASIPRNCNREGVGTT
ncbi:B3 domain-containing protein, partial [Trifolium pratense]